MSPSKYAFQAGLFILLSIGAAIFLIARVAESRGIPDDAKAYTAVFAAGEDIAGLSGGAEVRLLGVKAGRVQSVEVVTPTTDLDDASIHVKFVVGDGVELRETDAKVELQTAVTGGAWLNILSVGTGRPIPDGGRIDAKASNLLSMMADVRDELQLTLATLREDSDQVSTDLVGTADSIEKTAESVTQLVERVDGKIDPIVKDFDTLMAEATGVMTDIRGVFGDSGEDIRTTLANFSSLTTKLDEQLPGVLEDVSGFVGKAGTSLDGIDQVLDGANALLADNKPEIDRMVQSARRSADELEGLIDDLRANPSRLLWPPDEKDLKNIDLYAAARAYAKAAEDLESAAASLQQASSDGNANDEELDTMRKNLLLQFEHFDKLQEALWTRFEK